MKKIISLLAALTIVFSLSLTAFAEDKPVLTPEQQAARQAYSAKHTELLAQLNLLRADTKKAGLDNDALTKQIKEKVKSIYGQANKDNIAKLKETAKKNKDVATQAKGLHEQRKALIPQFKELQTAMKDAVKSGNKDKVAELNAKVADLKSQVQKLNEQIGQFKGQIKANNDSVKAAKEQVKSARDKAKQTKDAVKPLFEQQKAIHQKIMTAEKDKAKLWETYKANIQAKDYTAAEATLNSIIAAKTQILSDIKSRYDLLQKILAALPQA